MEQTNMVPPSCREDNIGAQAKENISADGNAYKSIEGTADRNADGSGYKSADVNVYSSPDGNADRSAYVNPYKREPESPLLHKIRSNFGIFGGISLIFGASFTLLFYRVGVGLNVFLFTFVMILLLWAAVRKLSMTLKTGTKLYYAGAALLGLSTAYTSSGVLQALNVLGILFLLDLSLLHQLYEDHQWDFTKHFARMFGLLFQSIAAIGKPFVDCVRFFKKTRVLRNDKVRNITIGIVVSIPFLWIVLALLSSADLLFGRMTKGIIDSLFSTDAFSIGIMILFGFLVCYCILCAAATKVGIAEKKEGSKADASIAATGMTVLCLVYAVFCFIQLTYLFTDGLFVLPQEFTFAEYARRGFFELLAVTVINIVLILLCRAFFEESRWLRMIITVMTVCTYIMIASATYRMLLYIGAYHLTFLRVFVLLSLLIDALVLAGVIVSVYKRSFPLFRYCVGVISVCYIAFSFSKPDYYIADYLIKHNQLLDREDISYLIHELSLDAAPIVLPILAESERWTSGQLTDDNNYDRDMFLYGPPEEVIRADYYQRIASATGDMELRDFVYARFRATKLVDDYPLQ